MRIQEMDMREMGMSGKEQERTGKPSEAFYRVEKQLTIQLIPQKGNERLLGGGPPYPGGWTWRWCSGFTGKRKAAASVY